MDGPFSPESQAHQIQKISDLYDSDELEEYESDPVEYIYDLEHLDSDEQEALSPSELASYQKMVQQIKKRQPSKRSGSSSASSAHLSHLAKQKKHAAAQLDKKHQSLEKYTKMLIGLVRKNSLYNTLPIDQDSFAKYMNDYYLKKPELSDHLRSASSVPLPFKASSSKVLLQKMKRAACGNLNGNPMHKWICW